MTFWIIKDANGIVRMLTTDPRPEGLEKVLVEVPSGVHGEAAIRQLSSVVASLKAEQGNEAYVEVVVS